MNIFHRKVLGTNTVVLVLVLSAAHCCQSFNLDVRFSVVKEGKTAGSLFGLSVALHEQVVGEKRYLLLVGAPKEKAEAGLAANETGDIYACPITADPKDCKRLNLLKSNPEDVLDPRNDVIDGMWLGVSLASQSQPGGRVLACGHRYIRNFSTNFRMIGRCYVRGNDLRYDQSDSQWQANSEMCDPSEDQNSEGMCLAGMSASFTDSEILLGAPGCFNWQGNTISQWYNPKDEYDKMKSKLPDMKNFYNIYIGYSLVVDQDVLIKGKNTVISGAPRDEAIGSVMMAEVLRSGIDGEVKIKVTVRGEQVGSYFGNSVAVVDLNNDGWKDLIVGAPFYFDRKNYKGGAVYVYMNQDGSFPKKADVVLTGTNGSAFGMAVGAIGDVNQDGFQDFAVGAPYHGSGTVSIWMGSKSGITQNPSQVIEGSDIPGGGFQTFGYSINGGKDVDRNGYPDIAVGSLDDRVVLLRSRPVIHLKNIFTVTPTVINLEDCDACIEAKFCFSYTFSTGTASSQKTFTFQYTVEADQQSSRSSRVRFLDNKEGKYTGKMSVKPSGDCHSLKLELVSKMVQDKVSPIVFLLSASLVEPPPSGGQALEDLFPVISQKTPLTARAEIHIQKACGSDYKCESNLQMTAAFTDEQNTPFPTQNDLQIFHYTTDMKKLKLLVNVSNVKLDSGKGEDAYNAVLNVTIPASLRFSSLNPKNLSFDLPPGGLYLLCTLGDPFKSNQRVEIEITFETAGITIDMQEIQTELQLSTLSDQNDLQPLSRVLMVEYVLGAFFNIDPFSIYTEFSGKVVGESAMKSTNDVGSPVEFNITVGIPGKPLGDLGYLEVVFQWPYALPNRKWLLYLSEIQMTGTTESYCAAENIINPLKLEVSKTKSRRRKRDEASLTSELTKTLASPQSQAVKSRKTENLDCGMGTALCQTFNCSLRGMNTFANLTVRARVWNSTMLEHYKAASVTAFATLSLKTDKPTIKMNDETRKITVEIVSAELEQLQNEAPLWIIIVSVLAGVILLGLIVILLWKCGFFKRANTRELYEAKAQKAEMKTQPSENDRLTVED